MDFLNNIPEKIKEALKKANISSPQEILITPDAILQSHGCSSNDVRFLKSLSAKSLCSDFITVRDMLISQSFKWDRIFFGCKSIDACTGGVLTRGITEICGEPGAGKTQLLLQLSLMVQLPAHYGGLGRRVAFINTESPFPIKRLLQLAQHFNNAFPDVEPKFLENIFIEQILHSDALMNCVSFRLPNLVKRQDIGLIIIDSVAAVFRVEENIITRAERMRKLADNLLHLIDQYNCAVVCVNQVRIDVDNTGIDVPCLGLAWSNLVRTRLQIYKTGNYSICKSTGENVPVRKCKVVFSQRVPCGTAEFVVTSKGVISL